MKHVLPLTICAVLLATPAAAQVGVEPLDPTAADLYQHQQRMQREAERALEALRRNDLRRNDLADVIADDTAATIALEGRARQHHLDEAEIERIRAQLRLERLAREEAIRRRDREGR